MSYIIVLFIIYILNILPIQHGIVFPKESQIPNELEMTNFTMNTLDIHSNIKDDYHDSKRKSLLIAIETNNLKSLKKLFSSNKNRSRLINHQDINGTNSLMIAVNLRNHIAAKILCKYGANVDIQNNDGVSSLMIAAFNADELMIEILLQYGANVNLTDSMYKGALIYAIFSGCIECIRKLISYNVNINMKERDNSTALIWAVDYNYIDIVKLLVSHGAQINCIDTRFNSPLSIAYGNSMFDIFTYLVSQGASIKDRVIPIKTRDAITSNKLCSDPINDHEIILFTILLAKIKHVRKYKYLKFCSIWKTEDYPSRLSNGNINFVNHLEHTLHYVIPEKRNDILAPIVNIPYLYNKSDFYSLHIIDRDNKPLSYDYALYNYDLILQFSPINVYVIKYSGYYPEDMSHRVVYVPYLIPVVVSNCFRTLDIVTFYYSLTDRRMVLSQQFQKQNISVINFANISNVCDNNKCNDDYVYILQNTKILVNIHQDPAWGMICEELRILPALLYGVIIIQELCPLYELIPYHEYIVWSTYDSMVEVTQMVHSNYDKYYDKFFGSQSNLYVIIDEMKVKAESDLKTAIDYIQNTQKNF